LKLDPNANLDTVDVLQKFGITHNDTPDLGIIQKLENLIIEEIAGGKPFPMIVSINGVQ